VTEIAVYVEGGGNGKEQKAELRRGFDALFAMEKSRASDKRLSLIFICCGGRQEAYEAFQNALEVNRERINALLVDSETAIAPVPKDRAGEIDKVQDALVRVGHLRQKQGTGGRGQGDGWQLSGDLAARVHLMVQCMEAWIVADPDALQRIYKQNFRENRLPKRTNLEDESKADLYAKLEGATGGTQKGKYEKIKHASQVLAGIDPEKVTQRCPRFRIFRQWLIESIDSQPATGRASRRN
jgi:hypothetical protein